MVTQQRASQLAGAMSDIPAPIYQRVKQAIISQIRTGAWQPHQRIPSESELVNELGVSRMTINRALRELTSGGFLLLMQGVGTFVTEIKAYAAMLEVRNIAEEIAERGHRHSSRVLALQSLKAEGELAEQFDISPGQTLFHSQIFHYENDLPVQLEYRYVNPVEAPDYLQQDFTTRTPYADWPHRCPRR